MGLGNTPKDAEEWRIRSAVLDEWNGNGFLVVARLPDDFGKRMPNAKAWAGQIAEQFGDRMPAQYLEGGGRQLVIDLADLSGDITTAGKTVKETGLPLSQEIGGIHFDFYPTNWKNVEDVYGYSKFSDNISGAAKTRRLASDEIQTKLTNSKITAATRTENVDHQEQLQ